MRLSALFIFGLVWLACTSPEAGDAARRKAWEVCAAANVHRSRNHVSPGSLADLIAPNCSVPCPLEGVPKDPWSVPLELLREPNGVLVARSCGPDRKCGTSDDFRVECKEDHVR